MKNIAKQRISTYIYIYCISHNEQSMDTNKSVIPKHCKVIEKYIIPRKIVRATKLTFHTKFQNIAIIIFITRAPLNYGN